MEQPNWESLGGEKLLETLQKWATEEGISDIHTSPEKETVRLEIRKDGMLQKLADIPQKDYVDFIRRVKFEAKLKLNVVNVPQDGQYTFAAPERVVNVRVASIPSRFGEALTLRLLDPKHGIVPLPDLGFPEEIEKKLAEIVAMPNGLFLVTGPTGSGKTTTLYALLHTLIGTARNIITLEDPVEYELPGIVQSEIDHDHDYDFASGLRSALRHDPDVVLLGEIRDLETAQTAVDAALTGHMVLATLHTNSAVEAIPRLLSMGVSPYTFAPALRGILAQRLVRTLSPECQSAADCDPSAAESYEGRMVLPELLEIDGRLQEMITMNDTAEDILAYAKEQGYSTMRDWGEALVAQSKTTQSEIERVTV